MAYITHSIELKKLIARQKKLYKTFVPIHCPIIGKDVVFNMHGFEHLHRDGRGHYRTEADAKARLLLLENAPLVITQSRMMKTDTKSPSETYSGKQEVYYELYFKVGTNRAGVVVTLRKVGTGNVHFYGMRYYGKKK